MHHSAANKHSLTECSLTSCALQCTSKAASQRAGQLGPRKDRGSQLASCFNLLSFFFIATWRETGDVHSAT